MGEKKKCCSGETCSKCFLMTLNSFVVLAGLVFIVLSIWLGVNYKGYSEMVSAAVVWTPLGVGLGLILVGLLGCCGILFRSKVSLVLYSILCIFLFSLTLVLSIFMLVEIGYISKAANEENNADVTKEGVLDVITFESVVFNRCCFGGQGNSGKYEVGLCPCTQGSSYGCVCYKDQSEYDVMNKDFDDDVCDVLSDLTVVYDGKSVPLVGAADEGGCGEGDPKLFQEVLAEYATTELSPGAWTIFGISLFLIVVVIITCIQVCKKPKAEEKGYQRQDSIHLDKPMDIHERGEEGIELREKSTETMKLT